MPWINKLDPKHSCRKPYPDILGGQVGEGSIWQCDECQKIWVVTYSRLCWIFHEQKETP